MHSPLCPLLHNGLVDFNRLKSLFDDALRRVIVSGEESDFQQVEESQQLLKEKIISLQKLCALVEWEKTFKFYEQYNSQKEFLLKTTLLTHKKEHHLWVMKGIDGKEYPFPSYETLLARMLEKKDILDIKIDQGFTKLLLVPFGMSLDAMITKMELFLKAHKNNYPTFARRDPNIRGVSDDSNWWPVHMEWDMHGDTKGDIGYYLTVSDKDREDKTKEAILSEQTLEQDGMAGWNVFLSQSSANNQGFKSIPRENCGESLGTTIPRPDIEAGKAPEKYFELQQETLNVHSPYYGESGMTPEEWIVMFMTHLKETNEPLDDYQNIHHSMAILLSSSFFSSHRIPIGNWLENKVQLLGTDSFYESYPDTGTRFIVRI